MNTVLELMASLAALQAAANICFYSSYLKDLLTPYFNKALCSQSAGLISVPRASRSRMGGSAFSLLVLNQLLLWGPETDNSSTVKS